jgi:hypothetical protein
VTDCGRGPVLPVVAKAEPVAFSFGASANIAPTPACKPTAPKVPR